MDIYNMTNKYDNIDFCLKFFMISFTPNQTNAIN